jgi:acyl dehydratase
MLDRYFEDFEVGQSFETRGMTITESQILDFALQYDPQPFHMDKIAARDSIFGELIASGMQTMAISFRLWYDAGVMKSASLGSPGIDELRWTAPVRAGDTLHVVVSVEEKTPSRSKPDRGLILMKYQVFNQHKKPVMSYVAKQIIAMRGVMV